MSAAVEKHIDTKKTYDSIAEKYVEFKQVSFRKAIEEYTLFNIMILPNESEQAAQTGSIRIFDLACDNGHYTRKLKEHFPQNSYVGGLDFSSSMIDPAKTKEKELQQGIEYVCVDAAFYLNYTATHDELRDMIRGIYVQLKPGGVFYSITDNVFSSLDCYNNEKHKKYSFLREMTESSLRDGMPIKFSYYTSVDAPSSCSHYTFYMPPAVYEQIFKECGFSSFERVLVQCDPNYPNRHFFDDLLRYPQLIGIIAKK